LSDQSSYRPIKIKVLQTFAQGLSYDLFVQLSSGEKFIKVSHKGDEQSAILKKYEDRGLTEIFLIPEDWEVFVATVRDRLKAKIEDGLPQAGSTQVQDIAPTIGTLSSANDLMKSIFNTRGVDQDVIEYAKEISSGTLKTIKHSNLLRTFTKFKAQCSAEYALAILTGYVACLLVSKFSWGNESIQEKLVMAAVLCDIDLAPSDFINMKESGCDREKLSKKVFFHPSENARMLALESRFFASETITIVEQHHELPDGKGYPKNISAQKITQLTAVYIIASYFVNKIFDDSYQEQSHQDRVSNVVSMTKNKFYQGPFRKVSDALSELYLEEPERF